MVCRVGCREESQEGTARGPAASVHRVQCFQALGAAPTARPETRADRVSPRLRGLSRDSALPSRALRRLEPGPRRDAGFACFSASPRWGTEEAGRGRGMSGRMRVGARPERRAFGRRSVRTGGSDLGASPQVPGAPGLWEVPAERGGRAGGCGAVGSHWLHKWEPHRGGQLGLGASRARTALAPKPWNSLPESRGPEVHLPQDGGPGFSPRAYHFLRAGSVLREGSLGTEPQRLCAEPHFVDGLPA